MGFHLSTLSRKKTMPRTKKKITEDRETIEKLRARVLELENTQRGDPPRPRRRKIAAQERQKRVCGARGATPVTGLILQPEDQNGSKLGVSAREDDTSITDDEFHAICRRAEAFCQACCRQLAKKQKSG